MESFKAKGKDETEKLHQRFKKLEQEWQAIKKSKSTASHNNRQHSLHLNETLQKPRKYSPRELMFNLQQESPSPEENVIMRTNDRAVQEILQERREAIETGKLKGRRLFQQELEGQNSSHEVRSISFYNNDDESSGSELGLQDYSSRQFSYSSSSSSCHVGGDYREQDVETIARLVAMITDQMRVASVVRRRNGRTRYAVFLAGVVAIICLVIAMRMRLAKSFGGDDGDLIFVPT